MDKEIMTMLNIKVLTEDGFIIADLATDDLNTAKDFVQDQIDKVHYESNGNKIGLYDEDYGYYCMIIQTGHEFEILSLEDNEPQGNVTLYDAKEFVVHVLEKEYELGGGK